MDFWWQLFGQSVDILERVLDRLLSLHSGKRKITRPVDDDDDDQNDDPIIAT